MCGVFGIYGHPEAANLTYLGLHSLQHRGQESAGIATTDGRQMALHRGMGQVTDIFNEPSLGRLQGSSAIGHVRYSTSGGSFLKNAQPIAVDYARGQVAVAHNGNLTNAVALRASLEQRGSIFQTAGDTEVVVHLMAYSKQRSAEDRLADALKQVDGAFSLVCLTETRMIAVRDRHGLRPLCVGRLRNAPHSYVVSSEASSFSLIGAEFVRDVEPGEMIVFEGAQVRSSKPFSSTRSAHCIFEYIYFARPDSTIDGVSVYEARKRLGRELALESPVEADLAVPVPDSGVPATVGFAQAAGIPFELGLVRSHYVGRTFIEPQQSIRHFGVKLKLSPVPHLLKNKRVVVVDDSIVRGTTSRKIVRMLREAGAKEVHLRISSPPTAWPCYYGIDTPTRSELIASSHTVEQINRHVTSDSLAYLSLEGTRRAIVDTQRLMRELNAGEPSKLTADFPEPGHFASEAKPPPQANARLRVIPQMSSTSFCHACFSGNYPTEFETPAHSRQMRLLDV